MAAAAPSGFVQSLLSSLGPWLTGSAVPSANAQYGGTGGLMDAMLQSGGPDTTYSRLGAALQGQQTSALKEAAQRQQLAQQGLGLQFASSLMPLRMAIMRQRMARMGYGAQPGAPAAAAPMDQTSGAQPPPPAPAAPTDAPSLIRATPQQLAANGQPQGYLPPLPQQSGPPGAPPSAGPYQNVMDDLGDAQMESLLGMPGAQTDLDVAKTRLQYDPAVATQLAVAKNAMTQDQAMYQQAMRQGNPQGAQAAYMRYLQDSGLVNVSKYNGVTTTFGGITPQSLGISTLNPGTGIAIGNGRASIIPGYDTATGQISGAKAAGTVMNTPREIPTGGGGSRFGYPGDIIGLPPALRQPKTAPAAPPARPSATQPSTAQGLSRQSAAPKSGDVWSTVPKLDVPQNIGDADYFTRGRLQAAGKADIELSSQLGEEASTADQQLEYNREAAQELGGSDTGPMSEWLTRMRSGLIEAGVPESLIPKSGTVVPTLELNKSLKNAALQGARQLYGSRMTQTEVKLQTEEMSPSASMMSDAVSSLMRQNDIRLMYSKAMASDYDIYRQHGGDPTRYRAWYAMHFPIQKFAQAASSMTMDQLTAAAKQRGISQ